jgi:SAM-dependent methyltransferase
MEGFGRCDDQAAVIARLPSARHRLYRWRRATTGAVVSSQSDSDPSPRVCNICGGTSFSPGFNGRMSRGRPPSCDGCGSVERHRAVHSVFIGLLPMLRQWRALHFAPDASVRRDWFKTYTPSVFGGFGSLDMMATGLPDASYDIVLSNHVLEHIPDHLRALRETLRVVGPDGVVQATIPAQSWGIDDWGFADPARNHHFREFGSDFGVSVCRGIPGVLCLAVSAPDPVTDLVEVVYLLSRSEGTLHRVWQLLVRQWRFGLIRVG